MSKYHGKFIWYDVMSNDTKASQAFYTKALGWSAREAGMGEGPYTLFSAGAVDVGGLMTIPDDARKRGVPPCWTGYIAVDDVDDYAARVKKAGGKVQRDPQDIPGVGRFAVVADPHGAAFIIMKGNSAEGPPETAPDAPGHVGWRELQAGDGKAAFAFYSGLFGWKKVNAIDMGKMGVYQTFSTGGAAVGGMMTKVPEAPVPFWLYYFNVEALDAAVARVENAGGKIALRPTQVPTGQWIAQAFDPQGAMFGLLAPKR
ncbi:MAG TPA: VOC family protein [Burkholderiales bacterium]|nr:VOC family protein [Burkholderiales bacterium]